MEANAFCENKQKYLNAAVDIASQCDRCGSCTTVCPLFKEKGIESAGARGKNNLVHGLAKEIFEPSSELTTASNFCLLCRACVDNCPNKVETDEAMISLRQHLADADGGTSLKYQMVGGLMGKPYFVMLTSSIFKTLRFFKLNKLVPAGLIPSEFTKTEYEKNFPGPAALGTPPVLTAVDITPTSRVAYFHACGMDMMFPNAVKSSKQLIEKVSKVKPTSIQNNCCGIVHLVHGLRDKFITLAKKNIELYEDVDVVVTDCASCSGTLKHTQKYFQEDSLWYERAQAFSNKVMGLSEYLAKAGYKPKNNNVKLTFHEPCHLGRGQGIKNQPRELLNMAGHYIEMKDADKCCGGSGTFAIDFPEVSDRLLCEKGSSIEQTGADIVVTECPVCLSQMSKASQNSHGRFRAMHISQVL